MTVTDESIKNKTYTVNTDIVYVLATTEMIHIPGNTWILSEQVKAVSTNRIDGNVKLRIASRAMTEYNRPISTI